MTERLLDPAGKIPRKWPLWRTVAAIGLAAALALFLARLAIGEAVGRALCAQQGLSCTLRISRLGLGGLTLKQVSVKGPSANTPPLTVDELAVDLDWANPFSPRATAVAGEGITLRLDLTGHRPLLGDLDSTVRKFASQPPGGGPAPRLDLRKIRLIANTPLGPVEATGQLAMTDPDHFTLRVSAPALKLTGAGAVMDLGGMDIDATASGDTLTARATLDVRELTAPGTSLHDLKVDVALDQLAGVLKGHGDASAREIALKQGGVHDAVAGFDLEAAAIDLKKPPGGWIAGMRKLHLGASTGAGSAAGLGWASGSLKVNLDPREEGGAAGDLAFTVEKATHDAGVAGKVEVGANLALPAGFAETSALTATGVARVRGAALSKASGDRLGDALEAPLRDVAPTFAAAAGRTLRQAGEAFEVVLPWTARVAEDGYSAAVLTGAELKARSGFSAVLDGGGQPLVARWTSDGAGGWTAAGSLRLSGGGGPRASLDLAHAEGAGAKLAATGDGDLRSWRVGEDVLSGHVRGLTVSVDGSAGRAAGEAQLTATGSLAGGVWTGARASGAVSAVWGPDAFVAEAPKGLALSWDKAAYGGVTVGAGALRYTPRGKLAERRGGGIGGEGQIAAVDLSVNGADFDSRVTLGATDVSWTSDKTVKAAFKSTAPRVSLPGPGVSTPAPGDAGSFRGNAEFADGWRVAGALKGGQVRTGEANIDAVDAVFDLSGKGGALRGSLADVGMAISDPRPKGKQVFEPLRFDGGANLEGDVARFSGTFTLAQSGVQLASVTGAHDLGKGDGSLTFAPTPLIFKPRGFQPSALSPLLIGPANVSGRVDISGGASWTPDAFKSDATIDLRKLGFALASAGVFEGVSGKVELNDVLKMTSAPGQTITIDKVTLGLPIENGTIKLQLIGFDAVRLQGAEWPFAGGLLRIQPLDFKFGAASNRVVAEAVNWDIAKVLDLAKVPDLSASGSVSGSFPVVFSTGSARIDNAVLKASKEGGVIHYVGSTGEAAGQSDSNAKMLFDALKDFRYQELELDIDGDIAGKITVAVQLLGQNPTVLGGARFKTRISVESELMNLLNTANQGNPTVNAIVDRISGAAAN